MNNKRAVIYLLTVIIAVPACAGTDDAGKVNEEALAPKASAKALKNIGPETIEGLIEALKSEEPDSRAKAAKALGNTKDSRAVEPLTVALSDKEPKVRKEAAIALGKIKDPNAVEALITTLNDKNEGVCYKAGEALGEIQDACSIEKIVGIIKSNKNQNTRDSAFLALGGMGDLSLDVLITLADGEDKEISVGAIKTLSNMSSIYNARYYHKLKNTQKAQEVILELFEQGGGDIFSLNECIDILSQIKEPRAVKLMLLCGSKYKDEWTSLKNPEDKKAPEVISLAFQKMEDYAVVPLIEELNNENVYVRIAAAESFGYLRFPEHTAKKAVEPLILTLKDKDADVRKSAVFSLGILKSPRAVDPLIEVLGNKDEVLKVRLTVIWAFQVHLRDVRVVEPLMTILKDKSENASLRAHAASALQPYDESRVKKLLEEVRNDKSEIEQVRQAAIPWKEKVKELLHDRQNH